MKANVNDRVIYNGEAHTVLRVHVSYELDGICIPVEDCDITIVQTKTDDEVMEKLCEALGMTVQDLWMKRRTAKLTTIRYAIFFQLHEREHWSYRRIARVSMRDHVACFVGVRRFRELLDIHDREAIVYDERLNNV